MRIKHLLSAVILAVSINSPVVMAEVKLEPVKLDLMSKLNKFQGFKSDFVQVVVDAEGNALQNTMGELVVKRPNLIYWNTQQPDETLVVSDGQTLWFYNPFVEQVSAFTVANEVVNTPILLLSDTRPETWQDYTVNKLAEEQYQIVSMNSEAQVKSLTLLFNKNKIAKFSIEDATGQLSHFTLSNMVTSPVPSDSTFTFSLPEGVDFDDQR